MQPTIAAYSSKVRKILSNLKSSEVAEALIATWCVEYLRVRRLGGFNVVEIIAISVLMLSVKAIIMEANRRRYSDKARTFVMSTGTTQMDEMGVHRSPSGSYRRFRRSPDVRRRQPRYRNPYPDL
jgi:hypothetical protein